MRRVLTYCGNFMIDKYRAERTAVPQCVHDDWQWTHILFAPVLIFLVLLKDFLVL